jgi:mannose-6-phosphate isomerase-like protein (cupin superfamily)
MERRDFVLKTSILAAFGGLSQSTIGSPQVSTNSDPILPFLLPSMPLLDHKGGMDIRVWVRSSMTNGLYSSVECAVAPKLMGPSPHYHKELDELMYVIDGTASILIGEEVVEVQTGGWHLRPRMLKHTFWNASDQPLRFFDMYFNQPFEEYLEQVFHELTAEKGFPDGSEAKKNRIKMLHEKFGLFYPPNAFAQRQEIMKKYDLK